MSTFDHFIQIMNLALVVACGGVVLMWLPPGAPGGRRLRDWAALAAASTLLGLAAFSLVSLLGVRWWIMSAVLAVLFVVRLALRPWALAPRHEPPLRRESTSARCVLLLAWLGALSSLFGSAIFGGTTSRAWEWLNGGLVLAVLVLIDSALESAGCRALVRAAAISAFGAVVACAAPAFEDLPSYAALFFSAGAACTIPWYRRADRRALILAAVFFAVPIAWAREGWLLSAAGMLTLVIGTPRPSRRIAIGTCAALVVLFGVAGFVHPLPGVDELGPPHSNTLYALVAVLFSAMIVARWFDMRRIRLPAWNPSGAAVGHERAMLLRTLLFALIFAWLARAMRLDVRLDFALLPALLVLVILFGSSLERLLQRA